MIVVWKSDLNQHRFLRFHFTGFYVVLVSIEKIYQTLKKVFHHSSTLLTIILRLNTIGHVLNEQGTGYEHIFFLVWIFNIDCL